MSGTTSTIDDAEPLTAPDVAKFRKAFGHVPTSVAIVAGFGDTEAPYGLAVGTLTSVSLDPLLVAFCVGESSQSWPKIRSAGKFCISVLSSDQSDVCAIFASKSDSKFDRVDWSHTRYGQPQVHGSVVTVDCVLDDEYRAGDHSIVVGRVMDLRAESRLDPLVFHNGRYGGVDGG